MRARLAWCLCVGVGCGGVDPSDQNGGDGTAEEGSSAAEAGGADGGADGSADGAEGGVDGSVDDGGDAPNDGGDGADGADTSSDTGEPAHGCKRGLAYGYHSPADLDALSPAVTWWYNWASQPDPDVSDVYLEHGFEYVPMVWGGNFDADAIAGDIRADATALLGFNEPNFFAQANLSPEQAAARWPELEAIADAHDLDLVSPAVNFCGGGCWNEDPFAYLDDFFAACEGCRVDALAVHWYACDGPALEWYLGELERFDLPIWLTEFSCGDGADLSLAVQLDYMEDALMILEANDRVARYAWFSGRTDVIPNVSLLGGDGELTELGELYVSAPAACD